MILSEDVRNDPFYEDNIKAHLLRWKRIKKVGFPVLDRIIFRNPEKWIARQWEQILEIRNRGGYDPASQSGVPMDVPAEVHETYHWQEHEFEQINDKEIVNGHITQPLESRVIPFIDELSWESRSTEVRQITMPCATQFRKDGVPHFDPLARVWIYRPKNGEQRPVVMCFPNTGYLYFPHPHVLAFLAARSGLNPVVCDNTREINGGITELEDIVPASQHLLGKYRQVVDLLKHFGAISSGQGFATVGNSLGALISSAMLPLLGDGLVHSVLGLGGGPLGEMMRESTYPRFTRRIEKIGNVQEVSEYIDHNLLIQGTTMAPCTDQRRVTMINASGDQIVPYKNQRALTESFPAQPEVLTLFNQTHKGALFPYIGRGNQVFAFTITRLWKAFGMEQARRYTF